jgi:tetratricopeptide (TPR) repeat protein
MTARVCSPLVLALLMSMGLSGCQSSEERAQDHYESATELLAQNDPARAYLEFRNALQLQPNNVEFLEGYAEALEENGRLGDAYRQRLRLAELQPEDVEAATKVARMAVIARDWETAETYAGHAAELAPEAPETRELQLALAYRDAVDDAEQRQALFDRASDLRASLPESRILRTIILDVLLREGRNEAALEETDTLIADYPEIQEFYRSRLQALVRLGRQEEIEKTLREIVDRFPGDEESKALLVRYYISRDDIDKA